ncbi:hypothetical protein [Pseudopedobacter sp.]|uniref:hypothetical protein n=1 Tax=Pseudopedobacter sp. TaxID=1936787 RepID=UPI00333EBB80
MKRLLLSMALLATANFTFAQFTADKLVVVKTIALPANSNVGDVSLLQLNLDGTPVVNAEEKIIPTFYIGLTASTVNNGILKLSSDKKYLTMYGHTTYPSSGNLASTTDARTVMFIDEFQNIKTINTATIIHSATQVRACFAFKTAENLYDVYLSGGSTSATAGLQYAKLNLSNNSMSAPIRIGEYTVDNKLQGLNSASINVFNNQLYAATGLTNATNYLFTKIGSDVPTEVASVTDLSNTSPLNVLKIPGDFVFFGKDLLYIADETKGIYKFYSTDNGETWIAAGFVDSNISGDLGLRGMTGRIENGKVTLYAVTIKSKGNSIVKIVDETAKNQIISNSTTGVSITTLSTATSTVGYRGISFTPNSTITLPVTLNSFTAKPVNSNVLINWSTVSEQNNKHFEILRSTDGISFSKIGEVNGKNNSSTLTQYTFTDYSPASGTNYYQLKQVDFNGKSETFGPVPVKLNFTPEENIKIINKNGSVILSINSEFTDSVNLTVTDVTGRVILSKKSVINKGDNNIALNTILKQDAIYVLNLEGKNLNKAVKFRN